MSEELKQAAQAALEQLEFLNTCYPHKTATDASDALRRALTQRPAAQTEREAFENAALAKWGPLDFERSPHVPEMYYNQRLDDAWIGFGFAVAWLRASLPAPPQATPEPVLRFCPGCGSVGDVPDTFRDCCPDGAKARLIPASLAHSCHDLFKLAIGAAQQSATPEPVGERATVPRDAWDELERERDLWRTRARTAMQHHEGEVWYWMGDGEDHPESLVNTLPVVIRADQLRELLARPAPGVPDVDPLQGAANWFIAAIPDMTASEVARRLTIGYNRASRLLAAAQAKGADHG